MRAHPAQPVGERRAARARNRPVLPEHQVVDEQLRPLLEQLGQRLRPALGREPVLLLDPDPWQLAPLPLDALRVLLQLPLGGQQLLARRLPLLLRPDLHRTSSTLTSSSLERCDGGKLIGRAETLEKLRPAPAQRCPHVKRRADKASALSDEERANPAEPTPGLEPGTPSLRVKCSTS